jgi:hypothetical protein
MSARRASLALVVSAAGAYAATRRGFASRPIFLGSALVALVAAAVAGRALPRGVALAIAVALGGLAYVATTRLHERLRGERRYEGPAAFPQRTDLEPPKPAPGRPLRFVAWGDARGGASIFERVRDAIRDRRPDFSIGLGDLIGMARVYQFEILREQLAATGVPGYVIPGNHDLDPFGSLGPYEQVMGSADWRFDVGDVAFIGLDSAAGPVSDRSRARFVEATAAATAAGKRVIVFTHHPPYPPTGRTDKCLPPDAPNTKAIHAALESSHATTFSGDFHAYDRREIGAVTQYVSGGAGSTLEYPGLHHYLWVEVDEAGVRVEKVDLPPRHESPEFVDRWITMRDEAAYAARTHALSVLAVIFGGAAGLGALLGAAIPRRRRGESAA